MNASGRSERRPRRSPLGVLAWLAAALVSVPATALQAQPDSGGFIDADSSVRALVSQPDGKVLVGGEFQNIGGVATRGLARLNEDGGVDASFGPVAIAGGAVLAIAVQEDGAILVGGGFVSVNGTPRSNFARLFADGSLDPSFDPAPSETVTAVLVQRDGRIVLGGEFPTIAGSPQGRLARLYPDGSLDGTFLPNPNSTVFTLALRADGALIAGGNFGFIGAQDTGALARLGTDGTVDGAFAPRVNSAVLSVMLQSDGMLLVAGNYSSIQGQPSTRLSRVDALGVRDSGFALATNGRITTVATDLDGRVVAAGSYTRVGALVRSRFARVTTSGALDSGFVPDANNEVAAVLALGDGSVLAGGFFTEVDLLPRRFLVRLQPDGVPTIRESSTMPAGVGGLPELSVESGSVHWRFAATAPELLYAPRLELSTDGSTWVSLGLMSPVAGGWRLDAPPLPADASYSLRAEGALGDGGHSEGRFRVVRAFAAPPMFADGFESP